MYFFLYFNASILTGLPLNMVLMTSYPSWGFRDIFFSKLIQILPVLVSSTLWYPEIEEGSNSANSDTWTTYATGTSN